MQSKGQFSTSGQETTVGIDTGGISAGTSGGRSSHRHPQLGRLVSAFVVQTNLGAVPAGQSNGLFPAASNCRGIEFKLTATNIGTNNKMAKIKTINGINRFLVTGSITKFIMN
jgi:hypothetical protein